MIPFLGPADPFPPPGQALAEPNGLLCASADLSLPRLLAAYRSGIFPWYSADEPVLWWSPDPRLVLYCDRLRVSRSLARSLRRRGYTLRVDSDFAAVLEACAAPRPGQPATWLLPEMRAAYLALHRAGHAHSFETWQDDRLVGGLYGVAIGRMFYGESMFAHATDASKAALVGLVAALRERGMPLIDCQVRTGHLVSLGAEEIPRRRFLREMAALVNYPAPAGLWSPAPPAD